MRRVRRFVLFCAPLNDVAKTLTVPPGGWLQNAALMLDARSENSCVGLVSLFSLFYRINLRLISNFCSSLTKMIII